MRVRGARNWFWWRVQVFADWLIDRAKDLDYYAGNRRGRL